MQFKPFARPHKFVFQDPDTGFIFQAETKDQLVQHITSYRKQNRLPEIERLHVVLENYWCSLPANRLNCRPREMEKGWRFYLKKGIGLLRFMLFKNYVDQKTADERGAICIKCPLNQKPANKPFYERWASRTAEETIGDRKSEHHSKLLECMGCGCNLRAKVWIGDNIELYQDEVDAMKAAKPDCWQANSPKLVIIKEKHEGPPQ